MFGSKPQGDSREGMTLIGEEAFFHGTLSVKGSLRVEGAFEGDISDAVEVEVGIKGRILGNVAAENVVDGETGRLVPPGDVAAMAAAVRELLDDDRRREAMGKAAGGKAPDMANPFACMLVITSGLLLIPA